MPYKRDLIIDHILEGTRSEFTFHEGRLNSTFNTVLAGFHNSRVELADDTMFVADRYFPIEDRLDPRERINDEGVIKEP